MRETEEKTIADSLASSGTLDWSQVPEVTEQTDSSLKDEIKQEEPTPEVEQPEVATEEVGTQQTEPEVKEEVPTTEAPKQPEVTAPTVNEEELRSQIEQELRASLSSEYESKAPKFANETIKKLNELAQSGVDLDSGDFWAWQSRDLDKYDTSNKKDAMEVVRLGLELENPDIPSNKIDRLLKRKYPALFDDALDGEDWDYQEAVEDLEIDAIRGVKKLRDHKDKITLPKVDLKAQEEQAQSNKAAQEAFVLETRKTVNNYKEQPYKLAEDLEIKLQVSEIGQKFAEGAIVNNQTFFLDNYTNKDENGNVTSVDFSKVARDMVRIADYDDHMKIAFEQGKSVGKSESVDVLENAGNSSTASKQETTKTMEEQIADQLSGNNPFER